MRREQALESCSFCGKSRRFGIELVLGAGVAICNECVDRAHDILSRRGVTVGQRDAKASTVDRECGRTG